MLVVPVLSISRSTVRQNRNRMFPLLSVFVIIWCLSSICYQHYRVSLSTARTTVTTATTPLINIEEEVAPSSSYSSSSFSSSKNGKHMNIIPVSVSPVLSSTPARSVVVRDHPNNNSDSSNNNYDNNNNQQQQQEEEADFLVVVYNPWDRKRYVCGIEIKPNTTVSMNNRTLADCGGNTHYKHKRYSSNNSSIRSSLLSLYMVTRIFEWDPPVPPRIEDIPKSWLFVKQPARPKQTSNDNNNNTRTTMRKSKSPGIPLLNITEQELHIPTVTMRFGMEVDHPILKSQYSYFGINDKHNHDGRMEEEAEDHYVCNIPCRYYGKFYPMSTKFVTYETLPMKFVQISMEGSGYYPKLIIDPMAHFREEYYSTTSFLSDVPLTYYSFNYSTPISASSVSPSFHHRTDSINDDDDDDDESTIQSNNTDVEGNQKQVHQRQNSMSNNELRSIQKYPPVDYDTAIKGASFLARNCGSINHREHIVQQLIDYTTARSTSSIATINNATTTTTNNNNATALTPALSTTTLFRIDSLSNCQHYAPYGFPNGTTNASSKIEIMRRYLFHLAFENQNTDDYITEKLWHTFQSGTIPIYLGASNIRDHLPHPTRSVIFINDFLIHENDNNNNSDYNTSKIVNITKLVNHLQRISNNRTLYYSYHQWRRKFSNNNNSDVNDDDNDDKNITETYNGNNGDNDYEEDIINEYYYQQFIKKYEFTKTHSYCRMCRFGYAHKFGLRWNQSQQTVEELHSLAGKEEAILLEVDGHKRQLLSHQRLSEQSIDDNKRLLLQQHEDDNDNDNDDDNVLQITPSRLFSRSYNRSTCVSLGDENKNIGRMIYPLKESWSIQNGSNNDSTIDDNFVASSHHHHSRYRCDLVRYHHYRTIVMNDDNINVNVDRILWDHDGFTDMEIVVSSYTNDNVTTTTTVPSTSLISSHDISSSSFILLELTTPFRNTSNMIVFKQHTEYYVESHWRDEKWKRSATASNKRARKRIIKRNKASTDTTITTTINNKNDQKKITNNDDEGRYEYLKGGKLIWIQNESSRIILMVDKPNVIVAGNNDEHNDGNHNHHFYNKTVSLSNPGTIQIRIPLKATKPIKGNEQKEESTTFRVRWIVEDIDLFHFKGQYKESYFSSMVVDEFFRPLIIVN